jgi:hypothetical protein
MLLPSDKLHYTEVARMINSAKYIQLVKEFALP